MERRKMPVNKPNILTDSHFRELVLEAEGIVIVDFWAPWCGPCIQMAPGLEAFSQANEGRVKVFKLDADDNPKTAEKYEIRSVPTIMFFKDGEPIFVSRGAMSQSSLQKKLDELLAQSA
jgi:thioredoxin 1